MYTDVSGTPTSARFLCEGIEERWRRAITRSPAFSFPTPKDSQDWWDIGSSTSHERDSTSMSFWHGKWNPHPSTHVSVTFAREGEGFRCRLDWHGGHSCMSPLMSLADVSEAHTDPLGFLSTQEWSMSFNDKESLIEALLVRIYDPHTVSEDGIRFVSQEKNVIFLAPTSNSREGFSSPTRYFIERGFLSDYEDALLQAKKRTSAWKSSFAYQPKRT